MKKFFYPVLRLIFLLCFLLCLDATVIIAKPFTNIAIAGEQLTLDGDFVQGGLVLGKVTPGSKVWFEGRAVRVSGKGDFIIGFHRDEPLTTHLKVVLADGRQIHKTLVIEKRDYPIQRIDGLPPAKVSPKKPQTLARIQREVAAVKKARKIDDPREDYLSGFIWPVSGIITGVYGSQRILNGKPRRPHYGVDIARPVGTPVVAPAPGVVTLAYPDMYFSGNTLMLDHGHGLSSAFLHLSKILVKKGDYVHKGQVIAQVGASGRVTGAHLDWRMNWFERRIDPQLLVPPMSSVKPVPVANTR